MTTWTRARSLVPRPLQSTLRATHYAFSGATAALRHTPDFIVIGGQRCGTTTIFKVLSEHPQVRRPPVEKGIDYFTLYYDRGPRWYRSRFPLAAPSVRRAHPVAFEACTYYLFHPFALERLANDFPNMKLVAMLRDPVERAYSAYKHEFARGFESEASFERALDLEDERLEGETERMRADIRYESHAHRHHAYVRRGQYAEQLERALRHFPKEQLHILESESFFASPEREFRRLTDFLELTPHQPRRFDQHNARPSAPMPEATRRRLDAHFASHNAQLADLLGRRPGWVVHQKA